MTAIEQAEKAGRDAAKARYKNHDQARVRQIQEYQSRWLYSQPEDLRAALVAAYNVAYTEESSYYIGQVSNG